MTELTPGDQAGDASPPPGAEVIYRHNRITRLTHALNALSLLVLLLSGLNIFMAEPDLFFGQVSFGKPALAIHGEPTAGGSWRGITRVGDLQFDTTGLLGASAGPSGQLESRTFPTWLALPTYRDLATARLWHFFFAWALVLNGALYLAYNTWKRHVQKDLWLAPGDLASVPRSVIDHILLRHPTGEAAKRYNVLQKLAYLSVIFVLIPGMVLTGLTMSPGMDAAFPVLPFVFAGRQSARAIHFIFAWVLVGFFLIHMIEMVLAGPVNEIRSILTGYYRVPQAKSHGSHARKEAGR
jgi:thiosulfate reductase cytochrome b subunit